VIIKLHLLKPTSINYAKLNLFLVLFLTFINLSNSQTIKGLVKDENEKPINGKLLIKKTSSPDIISEFCLINNGAFSYKLRSTYNENILLEVVSSGYVSAVKTINPQNINNELELLFHLKKENITALDEIYIVGKKMPFKRKQDTVVFNVGAYKDGTEKKVEDLLKKLPGIEINESSGNIKYNGKLIETVTLDGDNLFGYNYTLGTRNINVDIVEEIEAIENYSENPLLKGIEKQGKVALNLKLKENKTDLSGNMDLGGGIFDTGKKAALNSGVNLLGVNKSYKFFGTLSFNNVGINFSPFNYSNFDSSLERLKELNLFAEKIIPESISLSPLGEDKSNINKQVFSSFSSIFNLGEKLKAKVNLYYINDEKSNDQYFENRYKFNNETFVTSDNTAITKKPSQYRGDLELKHNTSKNSLLKYNASFRDENIMTDKSIISNGQNDFNSLLSSKNTFIKQVLEYTKKISNKKALQIKANYSTNSIIQKYSVNPSILTDNSNTSDFQNINSKRNIFDFQAVFLASKGKDKYSFTFGSDLSQEPFQSSISSNDGGSTPLTNSINSLKYTKKSIYTHGSYQWGIGKFTISPNYSLSLLYQKLKNNTTNSSKSLIFEPSLDVSYNINRTSFLSATLGLNKNPTSSRYLFENNILVNNRTIIKNTPNLNLQKNVFYTISYNKYDLFNQTEIEIGLQYLKQKGDFFSNSKISSNTTTINYFYLPEQTENFDLNFNISKFVSFLDTTFKLNSQYSNYIYKNIVNDSGLRTNKNSSISHQFFFKTAFNIKVNFENEINYRQNKTSSDFTFSNKSFRNKFKIIFKPLSELYANLSVDYFVPNLKNKSENYSFIDTKIWFKPKNKNWEINLSMSNLLNKTHFEHIQNTDVSTNIYRSNLLSRFFLLNFYYNF
jgi:hypothetical protein